MRRRNNVGVVTFVVAGLAAAVPIVAAAAPPTSEPPAASAAPVGEFDIDAARSGFTRVIDQLPDRVVDPPLPCPVAAVDSVNTAFAAAGLVFVVDDLTWFPSPSWLQDNLLGCGGKHGDVNDDTAPDVTFRLLVLDLAAAENAMAFIELDATEFLDVHDVDLTEEHASGLPDGTRGFCYETTLGATSCHEFWHDGGLVVGVYISTNERVDRVAAATVLGGLVPVVVADLAATEGQVQAG